MKHLRSDYQGRIVDAQGVINPEEPVFILRAQDVAAVPALEAWCDEAEAAGADPELVRQVRNWAAYMTLWRWSHGGGKVADVPPGVLPTDDRTPAEYVVLTDPSELAG